MRYFKNVSIGVFGLILLSEPVHSSNVTSLMMSYLKTQKNLEISLSQAKFDDSLDVLNYIDKLPGARPKEATIDEMSISYRFNNGLKFTIENNSSTAEVTRNTLPKSIITDAETSFFYFVSHTHQFFKIYNLEMFVTETEQDPVMIDCYQFASIVVGGSCNEADVQLLDAEIYRSTGDLVYLPVLKTQGKSDGYGINLRIQSKKDENLKISHTFSLGEKNNHEL